MTANIIDGKAIAAEVRAKAAADAAGLERATGVRPGLAVVLVGADPASEIYVRNKARETVAAGMASFEHQIDADKVIAALDPAKDVDGFHPVNAGRLAVGQKALVPCTPTGCMILARRACADLAGLDAVVVGRSNIVGKPMAQLLLQANCTVTIAHSRTRDLAAVCRRADLLVAAVGRPEMIRGDWIRPGAIVIDVGMNRLPAPDGRTRLAGDVAFAEAREVAGAITPVPGGVGPMTIACLLANTVEAARSILRV